MHLAAQGGHLDVFKFLSQKFAVAVHKKDNRGFGMLHCAAQGGHSEMACYLIEELMMDPQDRTKVCRVEWEEDVCPKCRLCLCQL